MDWFIRLVNGLLIIFLLGLLFFYKIDRQDRLIFIAAALLKIISGISISYIYLHYFDGGDSWLYFKEAEKLSILVSESRLQGADILLNSPAWEELEKTTAFSNEPRALFFTRIVFLLYQLTSGSYWLVSIYLSLFCFLCFWVLYIELKKHNLISKNVLVISLFFWPSVVFWSSGILKESISVGLIALLSTFTLFCMRKRKISVISLLSILLFGYLLFRLKYYYAVVFLPIMFSILVMTVFGIRIKKVEAGKLLQFTGMMALLVGTTLSVTRLHPNLHLKNVSAVIVNNYELFRQKSDQGKMVSFEDLKPEFSSFLYHSPKALFAGWFRPFITDIKNVWSLLAAIENSVLLTFLIFQLKNVRRFFGKDFLLNSAILIFCSVMAVFLSYSAPNFGTLVRYKVGFLPFLVMIILNGNVLLEWIKNKISGTEKNPG